MGWLIYLPAVPNWVPIFQNSMGGSNMTSDTLQDCIFQWLGFQCVRNVHHAQCGQFYIQVPILSPICQAVCS